MDNVENIAYEIEDKTETELLEFVREILALPRPLSTADKVQLQIVNNEFIRRDAVRARATRRRGRKHESNS